MYQFPDDQPYQLKFDHEAGTKDWRLVRSQPQLPPYQPDTLGVLLGEVRGDPVPKPFLISLQLTSQMPKGVLKQLYKVQNVMVGGIQAVNCVRL